MQSEDTANRSLSRVAVTGANGFLGSAVVKELVEQVVAPKTLCVAPALGACDLEAGGNAIYADICDADAVRSLAEDTEVVIHIAGPPSVRLSFDDAAEFVRVHAAGTACLLQACARCGVRRFIYISSAEVYGRPRVDFVGEDHPLEARSPYAAAKIGAETLVGVYQRIFGLETIVFRPFSVYGPGASRESVVSRIISAARAGEPIQLDDFRPVRDYCFVNDIAAAIVRACVAPAANQVFNLGTMRGTSVFELAQTVLQVLGRPLELRENIEDRRPQRADIQRLVADNRRVVKELGWSPLTSLEAGLELTLRAG
ncbi:MAG: NAD-dependent epimerase/dehydratase family protein [Acidobacteriaceae bacterium]|nr:NAD-dependent epimerase/dehydratase family protein [Acidobacteriaceae bacterium]